MVLAVVDDLMFGSRISAIAQHTGATVRFARTKEAALAAARDAAPRLVILDLDRETVDPIGTIAAFKADAALRSIRLVGYVSHVKAERIAEARAAGCDTVLARSAFASALPDLLTGSEPQRITSTRTQVADLTRADIEAAASRIAPFVTRTPMFASPWLSAAVKADVSLKIESMQVTGSFKARGAIHALLMLRDRRPEISTVVTASAGNHGLALAWAGQRLGMTVRVHLPASAPRAKRDGLARFGATSVDAADYEGAEAGARDEAKRTGVPYISPYNDADVIAGAGTVALEMLIDRPDLDVIVVPLGGGGLLCGAAIVAAAHARAVGTIGAEAEASPVFTAALAQGRITEVPVSHTLADGLAGNLEPGSATFPLVERLVDGVALVAEGSIEAAMRGLIAEERLVAEGAGAAGVAAVLQGGLGLADRKVGVILSGRNVDWQVLRRVLTP